MTLRSYIDGLRSVGGSSRTPDVIERVVQIPTSSEKSPEAPPTSEQHEPALALVDSESLSDTTADADTGGNGIHAITRSTNYWFEREVHVIERKAEEWAGQWAAIGLPRHDVPRTEPFEPEQVLAKLSAPGA